MDITGLPAGEHDFRFLGQVIEKPLQNDVKFDNFDVILTWFFDHLSWKSEIMFARWKTSDVHTLDLLQDALKMTIGADLTSILSKNLRQFCKKVTKNEVCK